MASTASRRYREIGPAASPPALNPRTMVWTARAHADSSGRYAQTSTGPLPGYGSDEYPPMRDLNNARRETATPEAVTAPALRIRCPACRRVRHDQCERRIGEGECRCLQCWKGEITSAAWRRARDSTDTGLLRASLRDVLALVVQRDDFRRRVLAGGEIDYGACLCGCGRKVIGGRMGPHRRYATAACRQRAYRRRRADLLARNGLAQAEMQVSVTR